MDAEEAKLLERSGVDGSAPFVAFVSENGLPVAEVRIDPDLSKSFVW